MKDNDLQNANLQNVPNELLEYTDAIKNIAKEYIDNEKVKLDNNKINIEQCGAAALSYILSAFGDTVTANYYFPWSLDKFVTTDQIGNLIKAGSYIALAIDKYYKKGDEIFDVEVLEDSMREKLKKLNKKLDIANSVIKDSFIIDEKINEVSNNISNNIDSNIENDN